MGKVELEKWNERYSDKAYAYGTEPNKYLKEQLTKLVAGKILFPAEGEGRNAVYAAKLGWEVDAFDMSNEGREKALLLAKENAVTIDYKVGTLDTHTYNKEQFDAIVLIYAHFSPEIRSSYHKQLDSYLRPGGIIILEAFGKKHLEYRATNPKVGGPTEEPYLLSVDEIKSDFSNYQIIELGEKEVELSEGLYHNGKGSVIRFIGCKG